MAYVLSLRSHSPLKRSFSDNPYLQSCSPIRSINLSALRDIAPRNVSTTSSYSLGLSRNGHILRGTENIQKPFTFDATTNDLRNASDTEIRATSIEVPAIESCQDVNALTDRSTCVSPCSTNDGVGASKNHNPSTRNTCKVETLGNDAPSESISDSTAILKFYDAIQTPFREPRLSDDLVEESKEPVEPCPTAVEPQPFRRWMSTLRRRHGQKQNVTMSASQILEQDFGTAGVSPVGTPLVTFSTKRRMSDSIVSSLDYVKTMHSASITLASTCMAPQSAKSALRGKARLDQRSSGYMELRRSTDSRTAPLDPIRDEHSWLRAVQRRKIVEELMTSEESYISDLKVLINDYCTILTEIHSLSTKTKSSIQQNLLQILQVHEDLLADLHRIMPQADPTHCSQSDACLMSRPKHVRFHSVDLLPSRSIDNKLAKRLRRSLELGRTPDRQPAGQAIDTKTVKKVAMIFNRLMNRFFAYEEYGAHWTTMSQDLTSASRRLNGWQEYERGVEALSKVVASENNRQTSSRKALSFPDLLIKPIQRLCKYPLLINDLCHHTPVYDDPEAHAELEKASFRLHETIREVNKAKDDPQARRLIEITWQLQDRLVFQDESLPRALVFRLLGHALLCGVLHVAYQSSDRPRGQYMVCILYKSSLILATAGRFLSPYNVVGSIMLANASIEDADNGRGLQCHTAPHTWKLVFENGHRQYEIILSACSGQEEDVWRDQLRKRIVSETCDMSEGTSAVQDMSPTISLDIKSLGPVFGHASSVARRMSVHRAATLGAKQQTSQVIIKNTQTQKSPEVPTPFAPRLVTRSQSHMSGNHIPTLAPRRTERLRLEIALEDVWTKDMIPYPGIGSRRVENQIRASANSVMRKLSMASIASNFSRRSTSFSSMSNARSEDSFGGRAQKFSHGNLRSQVTGERRPAYPVVDFHNAPAAFLPADFELQNVRPSSRRRRFTTRVPTMDRCVDRNTVEPRPKRTRRASTQMMTETRIDPKSTMSMKAASTASQSTGLESNKHDNAEAMAKAWVQHSGIAGHEDGPRRGPASATPLPAKKFLKGTSKIFKFWA